MRAYFRVSPRFGVSMPWWLAFPFYMVWAGLVMVVWLCWVLCVGLFSVGEWAWRKVEDRG